MRLRDKLFIICMLILFILVMFSNQIVKGEIDEVYMLNKRMVYLEEKIRLMKERWNVTVTVTAYSNTIRQTNSDPNTTSSLKKFSCSWRAAVSVDLYNNGWVEGKYLYLNQIGRFKIMDKMNPKWKKRIDIAFCNEKKAEKFGIRKNINAALMEI